MLWVCCFLVLFFYRSQKYLFLLYIYFYIHIQQILKNPKKIILFFPCLISVLMISFFLFFFFKNEIERINSFQNFPKDFFNEKNSLDSRVFYLKLPV